MEDFWDFSCKTQKEIKGYENDCNEWEVYFRKNFSLVKVSKHDLKNKTSKNMNFYQIEQYKRFWDKEQY